MSQKESELLQLGKLATNKGIGATASLSLGLNAWDDFHNYSPKVGVKRFGVDVLGSVAGIAIGVVSTTFAGPIIGGGIAVTASIGLNSTVLDPWKNSFHD